MQEILAIAIICIEISSPGQSWYFHCYCPCIWLPWQPRVFYIYLKYPTSILSYGIDNFASTVMPH